MRVPVVTVALFLALAVCPPVSRADTVYDDSDSEYLKVSSFFIEPVGRILEWAIFRPIHAVHHWISPAEQLEGRPGRAGTSLRPRRDCVRY